MVSKIKRYCRDAPVFLENDNPYQRQPRANKVHGIGHPCRSNIEQKIAYRPTADSGNKTHDIRTEPIETFGRRQAYPADSKSKRTDKIEYLNKCRHTEKILNIFCISATALMQLLLEILPLLLYLIVGYHLRIGFGIFHAILDEVR